MIGNKYANWTVIGQLKIKNKKRWYPCKCNCGNEKDVREDGLLKNQSNYCMKCRHADKEIKKGDKFGNWTVIQQIDSQEKRKHYIVQCNCGFIKVLKGIRLRFGDSTKCRQCGSTKHNMAYSNTYQIWESMIQRCTNPNNTNYKNSCGS